jgi:uncharacterized protein (TIGR00269 family)
MPCILCGGKPAITLQQGPLCSQCFPEYFRKKVYRTIRQYKLFGKSDKLCFALSGGKDSLAAAYVVSRIARKRKQKTFAIGVDEGVKGYRDRQLQDMQRFCRQLGIEYRIFTFKDEYGHTIEQLTALARRKGVDMSRCTLCGILRRRILNREARRLGATRMVVGHNLDDEAETALMNLFKGSVELMARLGPATGAAKHRGFIPRVKPLYFCTNDETALYTKLAGIKVTYRPCPYRKESFRQYVDDILDKAEIDYPGTKSTIVRNMLRLLPMMKKHFSSGEIRECDHCGEPSRGRVCKACATLKKLGTKDFK